MRSAAPRTEFAFTATVDLDAMVSIGAVPQGLRRYVAIRGGGFQGPRANGEVLALGEDCQILRPDGVLEVDARYVLRTEDGVLISVANRGIRCGPAQVMQRLVDGEAVPPDAYYFRTAARFEAPVASAYHWMNQAIFIGSAEREAQRAIVHFHVLL
jgi:hypothetical protein